MFSKLSTTATRLFHMSALRQTGMLIGIFWLLLALAGAAAYELVRRDLTARTDQALRERSQHFRQNPEFPVERLFDRETQFLSTRPQRLVDVDIATNRFATRRLELEYPYEDDEGDDDDLWRVYVAEIAGKPVLFGQSLEDNEEILAGLMSVFFVTGVFAAAISLALGLWIALRAQARLARIGWGLNEIAEGRFSARLAAARQRDDLDRLCKHVDHAAFQIDRLVQQIRDLSTNIAHDLRTPMAQLRADLEDGLNVDPDQDHRESYRAALETALLRTDKMIETFNALMRIARVESGSRRAAFQRLQLDPLMAEVAETFLPVVEDSGRVLQVSLGGGGDIVGDRDLLIQLMANLISNSIRHTPPGSVMSLSTCSGKIEFSDNGPGIPLEACGRVLEPLFRLDESRSSDGAGLGLTLVRAIADLHDAELTLDVPADTPTGLCVTIRFKESGAITKGSGAITKL